MWICSFAIIFAMGTLCCVAIGTTSVQWLTAEVSQVQSGSVDTTAAADEIAPASDPAPASGPSPPVGIASASGTASGDDWAAPSAISQSSTSATDTDEPVPAPPEQPEPTPAPGVPLTSTTEAADEVPIANNPPLLRSFNEWDLAGVSSPMFLTEAINDFDERPLILTGDWSFKPHLSITSLYDGNIFVQPEDTVSDYITSISPGVTMRLGNDETPCFLLMDYTATVNYYMIHPKLTDVDSDAHMQFQWQLPQTTLGVNLSEDSDTGSDIDATNRVRRNLYYAGITAHHILSDKTSVDVDGDYTRSDYGGLISSSQVEGQVFFNYQYSPKTQVGLGGQAGYLIVPGQVNQTFENLSFRGTYQATGKVMLIGEVAGQLRQYASGRGDVITPIVMIEGAWSPRETTHVDITVSRQVYASALLDDQDYTASSVDLSVSQQIAQHWTVQLSTGYVNSDYSSTTPGVNATREDNYYYVRPEIQWAALSWLSIGLFYEYSQNLSSGEGADAFSRDRAGLEMAILF